MCGTVFIDKDIKKKKKKKERKLLQIVSHAFITFSFRNGILQKNLLVSKSFTIKMCWSYSVRSSRKKLQSAKG